MIASDLGRLAVFAALPFADSAAAIVVLAVLAGIGNAFFRPAVLAGLPNLVGEDELPTGERAAPARRLDDDRARAARSAASSSAPRARRLAYVVNAVTFAFSAVLVALIPGRLLQSDRPIGRGRWSDLAEGFDAVLHSQALSCVLVVWSIVMLASGIVNVAEIFLAQAVLQRGRLRLRAALGRERRSGSSIGGLAAAPLIERDLGAAYVRFIVMLAVGAGCAAVAPNVWVGDRRDGAQRLRERRRGRRQHHARPARRPRPRARPRLHRDHEHELRRARARVRGRRPAHERLRRALGLRASRSAAVFVAAAVGAPAHARPRARAAPAVHAA